MIPIEAGPFGLITDPRRAKEHWLILAVLDCAVRHQVNWVADILTWFQSEYIQDPYYRDVFHRVLAMQEAAEPVSAATIALGVLEAGKPFQLRLTDAYYLLNQCMSQAGHVVYYARQVHDEYRRQRAAVEIVATGDEMAATDAPDAVFEKLTEIPSRYSPPPESRTGDNKTVIQDIVAELEGTKAADGFTFGIEALDRVNGPVPPATLTTVGARSSNGKSVFLGQAAIKCAVHDHKCALFFSVEMSQKQMYQRWAAWLSRQPIRGGNQREYLGGLSRLDRLTTDGLLQVFTGPRNVEQITTEAVAYTTRCDVGLICVDYLQEIRPSLNKSASREQQVAHIASGLKAIAAKTGVPVMTASQLNKDGERSPRMSSLRESEGIGNTSDIVILLDPDDSRADQVDVDVSLGKWRQGKTDVVSAVWERPLFTIRDRDEHDLPQALPIDEAELPAIFDGLKRDQPWNDSDF